jgi:hypothetical protein
MKAGNLYLTIVPGKMVMVVLEIFGTIILALSHDWVTEMPIDDETYLLTGVVAVI